MTIVPPPEVIAAKTKVAVARADFMTTLAELKHRLNPMTIVRSAVEDVSDTGMDLARQGTSLVRANGAASAGIVTGLILLLFRKPIARAIDRLFGRRKPGRAPVPTERTMA